MITGNACRMRRVIVVWHQTVIQDVGMTAVNARHVSQNTQHAQMKVILHVWPDIIKTANRAKYALKTQTVPQAVCKYLVCRDITWMETNVHNVVWRPFIALTI